MPQERRKRYFDTERSPLLANGEFVFGAAALLGFGHEAGGAKGGEVDVEGVDAEEDVGDEFAGDGGPEDAPAVVAGGEDEVVREGVVVEAAEDGEGVVGAGPHAGGGGGVVEDHELGRERFEGALGGVDAVGIGLHLGGVFEVAAGAEAVAADVVRAADAAEVHGAVGPWVDLEVAVVGVLVAKESEGVRQHRRRAVRVRHARRVHALQRQLKPRQPVLHQHARPRPRRHHHLVARKHFRRSRSVVAFR
mmetsp:Transcript_24638/g.76103  ORF Transcript_24638/g.76103 Transcript_24638/m.76103 type:complete len:249 (-) Transcript_24638:669-1415(-)